MEQLTIAFVGGVVFDGSGAKPERTDVGVLGERIVAIGEAEVAAATGPDTRVINLDGNMLLPGIIDSHVHPVEGGLERIGCDLSSGWTREDYLQIVGDYAAANPGDGWIIGGGWQMAAFSGGFPLAADLDAICPDRPILVSNRDHHSSWVNSEVLRLAGITRDTPDPDDGLIERDAEGNPTGTLHEGARMLALRVAPEPTLDDMAQALMSAQEYFHSFGITGWQDALIGDYGNHSSQEVNVYKTAIENRQLQARVNGAIWWYRDRGDEQFGELEQLRQQFRSEDFRITTVKIMQDGVIENKTAAVSEPYLSAGCACGDPNDTGISFIEPERLKKITTKLDAMGLQVHFHAIGDRAVTECLDAVSAARAANGNNGPTHHIAHLQVVHPNDLVRFGDLRVAANMQPLWAAYDPQMTELNVPLIGATRVEWQYPFRGIADTGGQLVAGSDWPVTTADPWLGMHVAVNRQHPAGHPDRNDEVFVPNERLELGEALRAYTLGGAEINGWQFELGRIDVGCIADLVIVDRDPFAAPKDEIASTKTLETFSRGRSVFRSAVENTTSN